MNNQITTLTTVPENHPVLSDRQNGPLDALLQNAPELEQHLSIYERRVATIESSSMTVKAHPSEIALLPSIQNRASAPHFRNGKIARLPKLDRDMVNRMLFNHVPYSKIVTALSESNINVTERNVSNWKTRGGYKEWCVEQERQIQLSRIQDNLTDYLRKNDATQLPEVGLQVVATQLSSMLMQPDTAAQLAADPKKYASVVNMLCQVSNQINELQKERDETYKKASIRGTLAHYKREEEKTVDQLRSDHSSTLGKGPRPPLIPHRNELPPREELPYQPPSPKAPSMLEFLKMWNKPEAPAATEPSPKPVSKGAAVVLP